MKIVMLGDVMGEGGLKALEKLPSFIAQNQPDFIIANGENAANGFGITEETLKRMLACGIDIITSGNHVWEKREFWPVLDSEKRIIRPANYPEGPGRGWIKIFREIRGSVRVFLVINLQGRELMNSIDCPFRCFDSIEKAQSEIKTENIITPENIPADSNAKTFTIVDFHAESTREKEAFGFYVDGRAAITAGTHTHVKTADEKIMPNGTAYISDLGMTGVNDSVIGIDPKICIDRARNQVLYRMEEAAAGSGVCVQGIMCVIDDESGKAVSIERVNI